MLQCRYFSFLNCGNTLLILLLPGFAVCSQQDEPSGLRSEGTVFTVSRMTVKPPEFPIEGPFSPGILAGNTLYMAGQVGRDPVTGKIPNTIEGQTRVAMKNVERILSAVSFDFTNLVKCHVLLDDMGDYLLMNQVYAEFFSGNYYPARTTVEVADLFGRFRVEVSCIAFRNKSDIRVVKPPGRSSQRVLGPYSSGVIAGDTLYLSGQGGRDPWSDELPNSLEVQVVEALANIEQVVSAANFSTDDTIYANAYYVGCEQQRVIDEVVSTTFLEKQSYTLSRICVPRLPGGITVEVTLFADRGERNTVFLEVKSAAEAGNDIVSQMRETLNKLRGNLQAEGLNFRHVVNANVYLRDIKDFQGMNSVFRENFPENPPARTTAATLQPASQKSVLVEVALTAVR